MLRCHARFLTASGVLAVLAVASSAQAQLFGRGCDCAVPSVSSVQSVSVSSAAACQTVMQPVAQTCYQSVPVTEYHPVTQTVRRPKIEARIVNQDVVEYIPQTEVHTVDVPTVTYQNVTEQQQVCRNVAHVQTHIQQNYRPSPCEYDNRRNLMGWMNRSAYEFRSMFVPTHTVHRQMIPQTIVENVPVTRRVAVHGSKQVSYNVTKMVAQRSTRQVAMNHVSYEDVQTTTHVPRVVMKSVPIGTQMSFTPLGPSSSSLSLQPTPDSAMSRSPAPNRSANSLKKDAFPAENNPDQYKDQPIKPKQISYPQNPAANPVIQPEDRVTRSPETQTPVTRRSSPPSMVRVNKWVARTPKLPAGPASDMSLADADR